MIHSTQVEDLRHPRPHCTPTDPGGTGGRRSFSPAHNPVQKQPEPCREDSMRLGVSSVSDRSARLAEIELTKAVSSPAGRYGVVYEAAPSALLTSSLPLWRYVL